MTAVQVTRATVDDVETVAPLFDAYRQFYQQPSSLDGARTFLTERLGRGESVIFLARLDDGAPVGFTQLYPIFSSTSMQRAWLLNDLFVAPAARRAGVGRALLERAHTFARETNSKELMLQTAVDNFPAQRLYESLGWQRDNDFYVYMLAV
ncbi:MAG TPA: GNAT family N-acetyltransferase [Ktedonobacterales bacterium]|jgi:GNAT superfamily N-acetyltransferase|nr:GNAT family N-acetyltransferase [Ktedonobacterales bacterium]